MSMKSTVRRWATGAAVAAVAVGASAVVAPAAYADTVACPGPMICLYSGDQLVATYQDQTSYWQPFNGAHTLDYAANGFNPYDTSTAHVVYFANQDGTTGCIEPGREAELTPKGPKSVTALMIRPGGKCYPG
jgi:hypothetical protein